MLARLHERRGDWDAAAKAREEVLAIRLKQSGSDHWQTADARRAVEFTALLRGLEADKRQALYAADDRDDEVARLITGKKLDEAEKLKAEIVMQRKAVHGTTHWQVADALHGLGRLHSMNEKWDAMRSVNEEALAIRQAALRQDSSRHGAVMVQPGAGAGPARRSETGPGGATERCLDLARRSR